MKAWFAEVWAPKKTPGMATRRPSSSKTQTCDLTSFFESSQKSQHLRTFTHHAQLKHSQVGNATIYNSTSTSTTWHALQASVAQKRAAAKHLKSPVFVWPLNFCHTNSGTCLVVLIYVGGSKNEILLEAPYGSDRDGTSLPKSQQN